MKTMHVAIAAGLGLLAVGATPAFAAPVSGYVTANVNERSGPSTQYPPIVVIPAGSRITIYGCLNTTPWCDISWGPNRGWMAAKYLQVNYHARRIPLQSYSGVPFITFNFGNYWDSHYKNRPFYRQSSKWKNFKWQQGNGGNPWPKPDGNQPPKWPDNHPPKFPGNNPPPHMGDHNNPPNMGNGSNGGKYDKNCKWIDGKWVCGPPPAH